MRLFIKEAIPVLLLISIPFSVQAGVFSSLATLWDEPATAEIFEVAVGGPHDTAVLSAATNHDPQAAIGGGDVIVDDGSLVSAGTASKDDKEESVTSGEISVYTVRPGDTASQIAEMFEVSVNTIYWANDISGSIQPGDTLVILPINGVRHVVKEGETLSTIAKKYDGDVEEIISYNQLSSATELAVGDTVVIPNGEVKTAPRAASTAKPTSVSGSVMASGSFSHPLPGAYRSQGIHGYNGVDLAGMPLGTAVRAAAAGQVIVAKSAGWNGGYGGYVVIKHGNGTQTLYAHLSSVSVGVGEYVAQSQTIGGVGNTGRSTGTHLHFEVRGAANPF